MLSIILFACLVDTVATCICGQDNVHADELFFTISSYKIIFPAMTAFYFIDGEVTSEVTWIRTYAAQ